MRCAVLLRGINVGGHNRLPMADFRVALVAAGASDVETYLQSGNAVVSWPGDAAALQSAVVASLPLTVPVLVRSAADVDAVVAGCPLSSDDPKLLHAVFVDGTVPTEELERFLPDRVVAGEGVLYVAYATASHSSKASAWVSGKGFPGVASARNWRTVLALQELLHR